jgi:hypothetical protein
MNANVSINKNPHIIIKEVREMAEEKKKTRPE